MKKKNYAENHKRNENAHKHTTSRIKNVKIMNESDRQKKNETTKCWKMRKWNKRRKMSLLNEKKTLKMLYDTCSGRIRTYQRKQIGNHAQFQSRSFSHSLTLSPVCSININYYPWHACDVCFQFFIFFSLDGKKGLVQRISCWPASFVSFSYVIKKLAELD